MGHIRLGTLPNTRPWQQVVGTISQGGSAAAVAKATTQAAAEGLALAKNDLGFREVVYLLAKLVQAARSTDFVQAAGSIPILLPERPGILDVTIGFTQAFETRMEQHHQLANDIGQMAQLSAVEVLSKRLAENAHSRLFPSPDDVQLALRNLGTASGFAYLFHGFASRFTERFLRYHLDRELSLHCGPDAPFPTRTERERFETELKHHCDQVAVIVRRYAHDWYSKANWQDGISIERTRNFARHCVEKLQAELLAQGGIA
jgi:hypothetical protein